METSFVIRWYSVFSNPFYFIRKRLYRSIRRLSPELQGDVMDFGCGSKPYFSLFGHCRTYTGIDIEISGHPHRNEKIDVYYDGKNIPFGNDHFDGVFCSEVFEHVFNLDEILPEIRRVMKPGARMLVTCPFVWPEHEVPYDFARYSSFGIRSILERHGFAILQQEKTGHFPEVLLQQIIFYIMCFIPKRPAFVYYIFHQLFILPFVLLGELIDLIFPKRLKRADLFHNNVLLVEKTAPGTL